MNLEKVLRILRNCGGVLAIKVLTEEEKKRILHVESKAEDRTVFGMCKSFNKGLRESLKRKNTVALVIQTSDFDYPHHPYMNIVSGDQVIGELVYDKEKITELREDPNNFFLWDNFFVNRKKIPRDLEERRKMRVVYLPREPLQLRGMQSVANAVFGTPSTEGDTLIKRMLNSKTEGTTIGTCLVGFDIVNPSTQSVKQ